jgi:hypothetical protein
LTLSERTLNDLFSNVGIDSIGFYAPRFYLSLNDLARVLIVVKKGFLVFQKFFGSGIHVFSATFNRIRKIAIPEKKLAVI